MTHREWVFVWTIFLVSVAVLILMPPLDLSTAAEITIAPSVTTTSTGMFTVTGTPIPTVTDTRIPVPTATPMVSATPSATFKPSPTATITATSLPTSSPTATATSFPFEVRADLDRYIYVDQSTQHLYIFEHGKLFRDIPCSTGLPEPDKYTPSSTGVVGKYWGTFFAFDVYADDAWYLFKSAGSILIHSLPYTYDEEGNKVYQDRDLLGVRPSSHGCIRIAPEDAKWLTEWNPEGVPYTVSDPYLDKWR